jgi:hypothetical protein
MCGTARGSPRSTVTHIRAPIDNVDRSGCARVLAVREMLRVGRTNDIPLRKVPPCSARGRHRGPAGACRLGSGDQSGRRIGRLEPGEAF